MIAGLEMPVMEERSLLIQGSIRGLLRMHGLKVGEIDRNQFEKRVRELLEKMPLIRVPGWH
jgi:transposase